MKIHTRLMLILVAFLSLILLGAPVLNAELITANAEVINDPPAATGALINAGADVTLTEGTTTTVLGTVTVTDNNGCTDIQDVNSTFYRSSVGSGATDDENDHYSITCTGNNDCSPTGDYDRTYNCTFAIWYYADPTDAGSLNATDTWIFITTPYDATEIGSTDNDSVEVNTLTAISITPSTVDYGQMALGDDTASVNQNFTVNNTGNEGIDISLDGYGAVDGDGLSMTCTVGSIPIQNEEYSATAFTYTAGSDLSDSATDLNLNIPQRETTDSTDDVFWALEMPGAGVSGTCSGTIQVLAVSDPELR